jgi:hypothetical protein
MSRPRHFPDLDRLSVLTAVIVLAYALTRVIDLPARVFSASVFGSPLNLALDGPFLIHVIVAALISTGAESLIRSHPYFSAHPAERALRHWILPGLTALVLGVALATVPDPRWWWLELGASVLALLAVLIAEYVVVDPADARHDAAALALTALTYALALTFFALLYSLNYRALLSASLCGLASLLMALRAFTLKAISPGRAMLYALLVGLICAEAFWAVTYWRVTPGAAALLVMVPFYASLGLAQQHLMGRLTRRVWLEYLVVSVIGLTTALLYAWVWSR